MKRKIAAAAAFLIFLLFSACAEESAYEKISSEDEISYSENSDFVSSESETSEIQSEASSVSEESSSAQSEMQENSSETPSSEYVESSNPPSNPQESFVSDLDAAKYTDSIIAVVGYGTSAEVSLHEKRDGVWTEILSTSGFVGYNGIGHTSESQMMTPQGVFEIGVAFGVSDDPGSAVGYTKVDSSYYWVDDINSPYYNKFVSTNNTEKNWTSAEHISDYPSAYAYCLDIGYNKECVSGAGSAMFLHCSLGTPTYGCVAIPRADMIFILQNINNSTRFVIANSEDFFDY